MTVRRALTALSLFVATVLVGNAACAAETVEVRRTVLYNHVVLGGTVVPSRNITITAQMPGRVEYLAGAEGDRFAVDSVLVALDDDELMAKRQAVLAQMANADAALRNAGIQFNRELMSPQASRYMSGMGMPGMFDQFFTNNFANMMGFRSPGMERQADLYSRGTNIEQARNTLIQARSRLDEVDAKLRDALGHAPYDGVIVEKLVEVGDVVQPGQPLLAFADTHALQVRIEVPARLMSAVNEGAIVPARLDGHPVPVQSRVSRIFPMADPKRHSVTVKLELPVNVPAAPGMYAEVMIVDYSNPGPSLPVVPASALMQRGSLPAVKVMQEDGNIELRVVRTGEMLPDGRVAVLSGLLGGERLVADPRYSH